ncbi:MAG: polyamine aminopropyltransferase [Gammaproteobacteria bacterium]|nr:polyamine aminopropyltransferase [Gammaproteobacteria bacterium]
MQSKITSAKQADPTITTDEKYQRESVLKEINISTTGQHMVVDYWDCDTALLNDEDALCELLTKAAHAASATVMSLRSHRFGPLGVTAVAILAESHISIHTWPETGYAAVDVYTCGRCDPLLAHEAMSTALSANHTELVKLTRGKADSPISIEKVFGGNPARAGLEGDGKWFLEGTVPGCREGNVNHGFHITEVVHKERTHFQEYLIFDNPVYGRVLVLDGIVQLSTLDEHIYHEMLVHPTMFTHPNPQRVVIVGGGDGGTLREVLRHNPEQVIMIDIDEQFVRAAAKHLPSLSSGAFEDPRVTLLFEDASEALQQYEGAFDVAIIDCNDAVGPSEPLFEKDFYTTVARSLTDDGICAVQAGSMLDAEFLQQTYRRMTDQLGHTTGFRLTMPSYHCGEYVFLVASRSCNPSGPDSAMLTELQAQRGIATRHWSPAIHHASQVLPPQSKLW